MALAPATLTFDCADPMLVATFWAAAMGYPLDPDSDEEAAYLSDPSGATQGLYFQRVPEPKVAKNRVHLDLRPSGTMDGEVERLRALGASVGELVKVAASAADGQPSFWTVMGDPEGNEFCVLRGPGDGWRADEPLG